MLKNIMKIKYIFLYTEIFISLLIFTDVSGACSVFCIDKNGKLVIGRSYDWDFGEGLIIVNKRNQLKTAFTYWNEDRNNLASWTSKYGSITFVQYGRDIAFDGMNEAGLFVCELWLEETRYPSVDSRPSISVDQYVQYLLDNFSTVDEIIASDANVRIRPTPDYFTKIHFFAVDSSGNSIVVEFLNGEMVYHTKNTMPVKAITNNTYENSISYINRGVAPNPYSSSSLERFYRIANMISDYEPELQADVISYTFNILDAVKSSSRTQFQTSFDIKNRVIYFKSKQNPQLRYFHFDDFDFSCQTVSKMLDINANLSGDVTSEFTNYTSLTNETLIRTAWENLGYTNVYLPALQIVSLYPETFECNETTGTDESKNQMPPEIKLNQNYPNPFNPSTIISYRLSVLSEVKLDIYNMLGEKVKKLVNSFHNTGGHSIIWDGSDDNNNRVCSGMYFYRLETNGMSFQKKMVLIR
jgi:penicillin V acylase-like amidase (Ntn superfamily)